MAAISPALVAGLPLVESLAVVELHQKMRHEVLYRYCVGSILLSSLELFSKHHRNKDLYEHMQCSFLRALRCRDVLFAQLMHVTT